ncbi:hypothetical protein BM86_33225 [Bacillus thuringiensis]|nr:hypothetical protein [Bacillus thuringiensis]MBH0340184.1 hypothetical protein [Bacillus thuringiensis]
MYTFAYHIFAYITTEEHDNGLFHQTYPFLPQIHSSDSPTIDFYLYLTIKYPGDLMRTHDAINALKMFLGNFRIIKMQINTFSFLKK